MDHDLQPATGRIIERAHHFPVRVYIEDTDVTGIVYHANHLRYMERARSDLLRHVGIDQRAAMEAGEGAYAVADLTLAYRTPARLGDALVVVTRALAIGAASVRLAQLITRGSELVAEGALRIGFVSRDGRPRRQPADWRRRFAALSVPTAPGEPRS